MSPRIRFVTNPRCFFTCCCSQDVFMVSDDDTKNGLKRGTNAAVYDHSVDQMANLIPPSRCVNIISYHKVVEAYTSRQLAFPSDIISAFKA